MTINKQQLEPSTIPPKSHFFPSLQIKINLLHRKRESLASHSTIAFIPEDSEGTCRKDSEPCVGLIN